MEKAIKKAEEAGYIDILRDGWVLLDNDFWQCLGKAMGWRRVKEWDEKYAPYQKHWHSLVDHLADGGNVDMFFERLLK